MSKIELSQEERDYMKKKEDKMLRDNKYYNECYCMVNVLTDTQMEEYYYVQNRSD